MNTIKEIAKIINGNLDFSTPTSIQTLLFDSRLLSNPTATLFFAIKNRRTDGHLYIKDLYKKGVRNFVIDSTVDLTRFSDANFITVKNVRKALQQLAAHHRQQFDLTTIGITGSNGKTIVKEWLFQLLHQEYTIVRSPKSYNSQIGVPISVWQIEDKHDLGIFEAGISQVGEMQKIAPIIRCDIGIFTNIGDAHNEGFKSKKQKIKEKLRLFEFAKTIVYCKDHALIHKRIKKEKRPNTFSWSKRDNADFLITLVKKGQNTTTIQGLFKNENLTIQIPFLDDASIENAIHCWATCLYLGLNNETIAFKMKHLEPVALRLELKEGINQCTIINDSYNSDLNALFIALDFLQRQNTHPNLTLILSDILQSGDLPIILYEKVATRLKEKGISKFIGIGDEVKAIRHFLPESIVSFFYEDTRAFLKAYQTTTTYFQDESILIKGARKFEFEKISRTLAKKVHQTALEIDLNALAHNLNVYRSMLAPTTKVMLMVKAAAYGSGSDEVSKLLEFQKADYLAVAYTDEAIELRKAGIKLPILVLNPEDASLELCLRYKVEPEIYSISLLQRFLKTIENYPTAIEFEFPIHIKLDTGMHRLGFEEKDIHDLVELLKTNTSVKVKSIFSHLSAGDNTAYDDFTLHQINLYKKLYTKLSNGIGYQPIRHILNSSGITRFSDYQMDMVRLGIGLYGIDSTPEMQTKLQTVSTLKATISQIKTVAPKETVGYNRSGKIKKETRIATISIGYADGFSRRLSNGNGSVLVHGKFAKVIGNVCMDMTMIDITTIPEAKEGDEVIIFGKDRSIQDLAEQMKTIPYEIFTGISGRVKRVYFQE